nr:hypothetical protein [Nitrosomonas nitrosa]
MSYKLYDYINQNGRNEFKEWTEKLQLKELAKLNERLDKLEQHGKDLLPQMLSDTSEVVLKKLKVRGQVQLRPLLCYGPIDTDREFTLLKGAKEIQSKWEPKDAIKKALKKRQEVINNPGARRRSHEQVKK